MLLVDDILLFPYRSLTFILREVHRAAQEELVGESEALTVSLSELYMMLETNRITEEEFEAREKEILDRLDQLQEAEAASPRETQEDEGPQADAEGTEKPREEGEGDDSQLPDS
ncbi:MAG: gas vesicle protein GvpG [Planctomycetes bacterium]|nr:gas vesicle protein GvpG [Planctomycetota bacterium]